MNEKWESETKSGKGYSITWCRTYGNDIDHLRIEDKCVGEILREELDELVSLCSSRRNAADVYVQAQGGVVGYGGAREGRKD